MDDHPDREWPHVSSWTEATTMDAATLRLILSIAYSYLELYGRPMTVEELVQAMRAPGK